MLSTTLPTTLWLQQALSHLPTDTSSSWDNSFLPWFFQTVYNYNIYIYTHIQVACSRRKGAKGCVLDPKHDGPSVRCSHLNCKLRGPTGRAPVNVENSPGNSFSWKISVISGVSGTLCHVTAWHLQAGKLQRLHSPFPDCSPQPPDRENTMDIQVAFPKIRSFESFRFLTSKSIRF